MTEFISIKTEGLPDYAQSMIDGLQSYNKQKVFEQDQAEYARQLKMRDNSDQARTQAYNGDYAGAKQTAADGYNWDVVANLSKEEQARIGQQASDYASLAYDAAQIPDINQRVALFDSRVNVLKAHGATDADIMQARSQLGNDQYLKSWMGAGQSYADKLKREQELQDDNTEYQRKLAEPIRAMDGAILVRNAEGGYETRYTPGTKPMQGTYEDADGNRHVYQTPGTPGQSYTPSGQAGSGTETGRSMVAYMEQKGYPKHVAEGIVNNLHYESGGGNHQAVGDGGQAYGLAQWHPDRQARFKQVIGTDIRSSTPQQQLDFVDWELRNTEAKAGRALGQTRNAAEATEVFMGQYERPANMSSLGRRVGAGGNASNGGVNDINLGGGASGPAWQEETRNGVRGQVATRGPNKGKFEPYSGQGNSGGAGGKNIPDGAMKRYEDQTTQFVALNDAVASFKPAYGGNTIIGGLENTAQGLFGGIGTPGQRDWWAAWQASDNQIRNKLFGSALTPGEQKAYEATTISPRMDPAEIQRNITRRRDIVEAALGRKQAQFAAQGYDTSPLVALAGRDFTKGASKPAGGGGGITTVRNAAEARALAPGTRFKTPDGRTLIR